tara:strand:+ start:14869 stop:15087 length:219 start_codon:yes stop_codon:yes gene_type:complete
MLTKLQLIERGKIMHTGYTGTTTTRIGRHKIRIDTYNTEQDVTAYRYDNNGQKEYYTVDDITGETKLINIIT